MVEIDLTGYNNINVLLDDILLKIDIFGSNSISEIEFSIISNYINGKIRTYDEYRMVYCDLFNEKESFRDIQLYDFNVGDIVRFKWNDNDGLPIYAKDFIINNIDNDLVINKFSRNGSVDVGCINDINKPYFYSKKRFVKV